MFSFLNLAVLEKDANSFQAAQDMIKFQLRHGNDLLAMDSIRDCDVSLPFTFICDLFQKTCFLHEWAPQRATDWILSYFKYFWVCCDTAVVHWTDFPARIVRWLELQLRHHHLRPTMLGCRLDLVSSTCVIAAIDCKRCNFFTCYLGIVLTLVWIDKTRIALLL